MKRTTFNILFMVKRSRTAKNGLTPVFARVTVSGMRYEATLNLKANPELWNSTVGKSIGKDRMSQELNKQLEIARVRILEIYRDKAFDGQEPTPQDILNAYLGRNEKPKPTLIGLFTEHNKKCKQLEGIDMAPATVLRYETSLRHTVAFMRHTYGIEDIELRRLERKFIEDYEFYLKTVRKCSHNSTMKYLKNFYKIVRIALEQKLIREDPFKGYKITFTQVEKDFLEEHELELISQKDFGMERLNQVRDVFLFCCYTGLAFSDVKGLTRFHICTDNSGVQWIRKQRQKTKNMCNIPILSQAQEILKRYARADNDVCKELLPVPSNQKMNAYLKEIGTVCRINKNLTTHTARHTFATIVCLANGVSMENVAKMLGHSDTKMTRHYAKILDRSIMEDMKKVQQSLA